MEKYLNSYETMFIVNPQLSDEDTKAVIEKFTALISEHSEGMEVSEWGKRRLAYPINDLPEGYYVLVSYKGEPSFIAELTRLFNINENIMRSMTTRVK